MSTLHAFVTFWTGDPFLSMPGAVALAIVAAFICALAVAGLWRAWRHHRRGMSLRVLGILAAAGAGAALASVTSPVLAAFNAPGRLAYAGLAATMALVAAGLWVELPSHRLRWGTVGTFAGLSLSGLALTVYSGALPPPATGVPAVVGRVDPDRRVARRRRARGDLRLQPLDPLPPGVRARPLVRRVALLRPAQGRRRGPRRLFQKPGRRRLYHDR
ncbi:MAG: hypothetical protein E6I77_04015 [Chloroflexi bacterium]|nr:MAG: hypothetical protein E6I77_04015 [Chloroflexota bacterium]